MVEPFWRTMGELDIPGDPWRPGCTSICSLSCSTVLFSGGPEELWEGASVPQKMEILTAAVIQ